MTLTKLKTSLRGRITRGKRLIQSTLPERTAFLGKPWYDSKEYENGFKTGTITAFHEVLRILEEGK